MISSHYSYLEGTHTPHVVMKAALVQAVTNRAEAAYTVRTTGVPCILLSRVAPSARQPGPVGLLRCLAWSLRAGSRVCDAVPVSEMFRKGGGGSASIQIFPVSLEIRPQCDELGLAFKLWFRGPNRDQGRL